MATTHATGPKYWLTATSASHALNGLHFQEALTATPRLVLTFYDIGIILQRQDPDTGIFHEYAVNPEQLAATIGNNLTLTTGILDDDIILMNRSKTTTTLVSYRSPRKTGIYLENVTDPLRVPLPGLIMIRITKTGNPPIHHVFAVKERPTNFNVKLFRAPLPNIYDSGKICWGNISTKPLNDQTSLKPDWQELFATQFGNHMVNGSSKRYPYDIRKLLIELNDRKKHHFPTSDLIPVRTRLSDILTDSEDTLDD